jgi:hypothetical protein
MKCPSCGSHNREGAKFCGECAAPLAAALACRRRGTANPKRSEVLGFMWTAAGRALGSRCPFLHAEAPRREDPHHPQRFRKASGSK